jgi:hypothetical protein
MSSQFNRLTDENLQMKLCKMALVAAIACGMHAGNAAAQQKVAVSVLQGSRFTAAEAQPQADAGSQQRVDDSGSAAQWDDVHVANPTSSSDAVSYAATSGCGGCDVGGCDAGCCASGGSCCSGLLGHGLLQGLGCCDLGDPWTLFEERCGWNAGGWVQTGYHTSRLANFFSRPNEVQLHQAWLYAQREIDTADGFDLGGRIDYVYGTDGPDTQAFGTSPRGWDNRWDNGNDYGHAIPQLYLEAGYGDWSVIVGHFFTIIGSEVVASPDNFFYSHLYTMYNSEPFTHTGTLATYNASEDVTLYGGHVFGWDSGFADNGDAFLGGAALQLTDDWNFTYTTVGGVFNSGKYGDPLRSQNRESGYMHSIVNQYTLSERLSYVSQGDVLQSTNQTGGTERDTYGLAQYLIYRLNECWAVGSRFEWWSVSRDSEAFGGVPGAQSRVDIYDLTLGLNYRPHANLIVRPEVRYDWARGANAAELAGLLDGNGLFERGVDEFTFGIDTIFTF